MSTITTTVLIPAHSSSLPGLSHEVRCWHERLLDKDCGCWEENRAGASGRKRSRSSPRRKGSLSLGVLTVLCRWDGTAWRGLKPLLIKSDHDVCWNDSENVKDGRGMRAGSGMGGQGTSHAPAASAVEVLLRAFRECVYLTTKDEECKPSEGARGVSEKFIDGEDNLKKENDEHGDQTDAWYQTTLHIRIGRFLFSSKGRTARRKYSRLLLIIIPPHPCLGLGPPSLYPERTFASRLVNLENLQLRLQTLNGFFSTLGGGYFLCRYLTTAVRLARSQRAVALAMGDRDLAGRCTVNEAYNYVHAGRVREALRLLREVKSSARERGDTLTVTMCRSARLFAKRVGKAQLFEGSHGAGQRGSECASAPELEAQAVKIGVPIKTEATERQQTYDDFQRIRMVQNRAKI